MIEWEGYLEHQSEELLGIYTANIGKGGCTIFAEMVRQNTGYDFQGKPWCVTFIFAVHPTLQQLITPCAGVKHLFRQLLLKKRIKTKKYIPKYGDIIFLRNNKKEFVGHVGIVIDVVDNKIISIEGNTVDMSKHFNIEDGGAVTIRMRDKKDKKIVCYAAIGG